VVGDLFNSWKKFTHEKKMFYLTLSIRLKNEWYVLTIRERDSHTFPRDVTRAKPKGHPEENYNFPELWWWESHPIKNRRDVSGTVCPSCCPLGIPSGMLLGQHSRHTNLVTISCKGTFWKILIVILRIYFHPMIRTKCHYISFKIFSNINSVYCKKMHKQWSKCYHLVSFFVIQSSLEFFH